MLVLLVLDRVLVLVLGLKLLFLLLLLLLLLLVLMGTLGHDSLLRTTPKTLDGKHLTKVFVCAVVVSVWMRHSSWVSSAALRSALSSMSCAGRLASKPTGKLRTHLIEDLKTEFTNLFEV